MSIFLGVPLQKIVEKPFQFFPCKQWPIWPVWECWGIPHSQECSLEYIMCRAYTFPLNIVRWNVQVMCIFSGTFTKNTAPRNVHQHIYHVQGKHLPHTGQCALEAIGLINGGKVFTKYFSVLLELREAILYQIGCFFYTLWKRPLTPPLFYTIMFFRHKC